MPLFSLFCPHSGLSRCSGPAGVVPMLLAYQDREEGRNGSPFAPVAGGPDAPERTEAGPRNGSPPPPNKTRNTTGPAATMVPECSRCCQPIGNGSPQGKRERGKGNEGSPQAHKPTKRGTPPPIGREQAAFPLIKNSRQKISKKSHWVDLKKFSEKFFVGMFRGKEKPLALSQRKGRSYNKS